MPENCSDVTVLDETVLDALGQLHGKYDAEFVTRMITMFMETALVLLVRLKEAVANADRAALYHACHELKSCSATIGAYLLAAHCERLEAMAREGSMTDPAPLVEAIGLEYRRSEAALITRLADRSGSNCARQYSPFCADREPRSMLVVKCGKR